jgi:hypothetical protein
LFSGTVDNAEVVTGQEFGPTGLSAVKHLCCHKVLQISVVGQDSDWRLGSFKFGMLFFKATDDSEQFFIVNLVITLNGRVFLRKEGDRAQNTLLIVLREYSARYEVRYVGFQDSFLSLVEQA